MVQSLLPEVDVAKRRGRTRHRRERDSNRALRDRVGALAHRLTEVETIARGSARVLQLQFHRMANLQSEVDQLMAEHRRRRAS